MITATISCKCGAGRADFCLGCGFIKAETWAHWQRIIVALMAFAGTIDPDDHGPGCDGPYNCTCGEVG